MNYLAFGLLVTLLVLDLSVPFLLHFALLAIWIEVGRQWGLQGWLSIPICSSCVCFVCFVGVVSWLLRISVRDMNSRTKCSLYFLNPFMTASSCLASLR